MLPTSLAPGANNEDDPYDLGDVKWNDKIRINAGKTIADNTMTADMAPGVLQRLDGE